MHRVRQSDRAGRVRRKVERAGIPKGMIISSCNPPDVYQRVCVCASACVRSHSRVHAQVHITEKTRSPPKGRAFREYSTPAVSNGREPGVSHFENTNVRFCEHAIIRKLSTDEEGPLNISTRNTLSPRFPPSSSLPVGSPWISLSLPLSINPRR